MHGGGQDQCDPNLVPLLDLVLQLIMFFLMVVNFVTEQVNKAITLPSAQSARPMDKRIEAPLFLNMDAKGAIIAPGQPKPLVTIPEIRFYLKQCFEDASRLAQQTGQKEVKSTVVVRADRSVDYAYVYHLFRMCKEAGFSRLQIRADIPPEG